LYARQKYSTIVSMIGQEIVLRAGCKAGHRSPVGHDMVTRRQLIGILGAGLAGEAMAHAPEPAEGPRKRLAVITTRHPGMT
jgi:hypothetical protein